MKIGEMLKEARVRAGLTQEAVAEAVEVSRQTVSNWENERSYPDIISVIRLSDLYGISLDELLKGDRRMLEYVKESTDVVAGNKRLIGTVVAGALLLTVLVILSAVIPYPKFYLAGIFSLAIIGSAALLYQIIKRI